MWGIGRVVMKAINKVDLFICSTYYHVFITLVKVLQIQKTVDIIICDDIIGHVKLIEALKKKCVFRNIYFFENSRFEYLRYNNRIQRMLGISRKNCKIIEDDFKLDFLQYDEMNIFHDDTMLGKYLSDKHLYYRLLEDSKDFYKSISSTNFSHLIPKQGLKYKLKYLLKFGYSPLGFSPWVKEIEVNDIHDLEIPTDKVVERNRDTLISNLSNEQKTLIYDVFMSDITLPSFSNPEKTALVLTQPLAQEGIVTSINEQIDIYNDTIKSYQSQGYVVYIKPHPRDTINYADSFSDCIILSANFPLEVLEFNAGVLFDVGVTFSSSGIRCDRIFRDKIILKISKENIYGKL